MMKFLLRCVKNGCRLARMEELNTEPSRVLETPLCMLYTKAGNVPYLSRDILDRIEDLPGLVCMPLTLLAENHEAIGVYGKGVKKFTALEDCVAYCCVQDPATATPSGYNEKSTTAIWGRGGKYKLDTETYMKVLEALKPDWCQCLSDGDTDHSSTNKRVRKSVDRNLEYLDQILEKWNKSEGLKHSNLMGVIGGGHLVEERVRCARETAKRPVSGYVFEGLHNFGPETESFRIADVGEMLTKTLDQLDPEKPRILPGILDPQNILTSVELGFDVFDASYPYIASERGNALVFLYKTSSESPRTEEPGLEKAESRLSWEISIQDKVFHDDFGPLVKGCSCYTCTHHTRAYVNHLLTVSEILARVLLMVHNLHHFLSFFKEIRHSIETDSFSSLKQLITAQRPL